MTESEINEIIEYVKNNFPPNVANYAFLTMTIMVFSGANTEEKFEKAVSDFHGRNSLPEREKDKIMDAYNDLPSWIVSKLNRAIEKAF